jgi:hypothetical protein
LLLWAASTRAAETTIAVLGFELNDLTGLPPTPEERARTASIQPLLEKALGQEDRYRVIAIDPHLAAQADAGFGYPFDHADAAAKLGRQQGADWVLVGRLHKPSFLFAYIMAHLVDTHTGRLAGNYAEPVSAEPPIGWDRAIRALSLKELLPLRLQQSHVLLFLRGQLAADVPLRSVRQLLGHPFEVVPGAVLHRDRFVIKPERTFVGAREIDPLEERVGEQGVHVRPQLQDLLAQVGVVALLQGVEVFHLMVIELLNNRMQRWVGYLR